MEKLTPAQMEVLKVLAENQDKCFTYQELATVNDMAVNEIIAAVKKFELYELVSVCSMDGYRKAIIISRKGRDLY